jgi:regulatory protein
MLRQPFPGTITGIEPQAKTRKHLGERVNIFVNGRFSFALDAYLAKRRELEPGSVIDAELLSLLLQEDGDARAYATALSFLGYRIRSAQEIRARLERDDWPEEVIERVLVRLRAEKLVNDAHFAAAWVEGRSLSRPRGARALKQELRHKGVGKEEIEAALPDDEQEIENAMAAAQSKMRLWARFEERERQKKALDFLMRRGFSYSTARAALSRLQEDEAD